MGTIVLRRRSAMWSTDLGNTATRWFVLLAPDQSGTPRLHACYVMSGTDLAYGAARAYPLASPCPLPLLAPHEVLPSPRYAYLPTRLLRDVRD
eukprot:791291-Rhodomonas_salina.2